MRLTVLATIFAGALLLSACSNDRGKGGTVEIDLKEWSINPNADSLPKGDITFNINNNGPEKEHELVIIRTDFAADKLPTKSDGSVDEGADGVDVSGKIEKVEADKKGSGSYTLDPGKYVLICNLVDEENDQKISHYQKGMRVPFAVTE